MRKLLKRDEMMSITQGLNHLGLAVLDLNATRDFFVNLLSWEESGRDDAYPRTAVSDGSLRLTLWQVASPEEATPFNRRRNVGLHHLALEVDSHDRLEEIYRIMEAAENVTLEFAPELVGNGPRMHMMCYEPGGIRIEFIWPGH